jgi:aspartate aminotransferase-like enzyme
MLYAPGPVRIPDRIKYRMLLDPPYFTTSEFSSMLERIQENFKILFGNKEPVLIGTGSGSLGMEAAVQNFFSPGENVLIIETGKYGKNWGDMCRAYGLHTMTISTEFGFPVEASSIQSMLGSQNTNISGIFVTHVETTSAVRNDIEMIRDIRDKVAPGALLCVDAVSSLLTEEFNVSDYDVVISASQKALQCPPGLFFMFVNQTALARANVSTLPRFYFAVLNEYERAKKNITTFTPASTTIVALDETLRQIVDSGGPQVVIERARIGGEITREIANRKFTLIGNKTNAVTGFYHECSKGFASYLEYNYNIVVGTGVRKQADSVIRIMHFGWDLNLDELRRVVTAVVCASDPYP